MVRLDALVAGLLALLASAGCSETARDPVVLELHGERLRRSDFDRERQRLEARDVGPLPASARRGLLDAWLEQRALVIEARHRGILAAAAEPHQEAEAVSRLLAGAVGAPQVTDAEIGDWQKAHAAELTAPEQVSLRQVLVPTLNEAREVIRKLRGDPSAFDTLARSVSRGPEAAVGGYMGHFERGQLPPELEAAAFALPDGATSEPIQTPLGYHVLRVESRQQARDIPLEEARERIRDQIVRAKRATAERAFVESIMARARVNHDAALRFSRPS